MNTRLNALTTTFAQGGQLEWIGLREAHRAPLKTVDFVVAVVGRGLIGDRATRHAGSKRQVTLVQAEHLAVIASLCGLRGVKPELLRRNLVVSRINLLALKGRLFRIGEVLLEGTGCCHPCARMEEALGLGGYNAMRGHGGITAMVLSQGVIRVGAPVIAVPETRSETVAHAAHL